jgi:hypothetical protein
LPWFLVSSSPVLWLPASEFHDDHDAALIISVSHLAFAHATFRAYIARICLDILFPRGGILTSWTSCRCGSY